MIKSAAVSSRSVLVDPHGRTIRKLRLSLLDACNASCLYCMPEKRLFESLQRGLPIAELLEIVARLVHYGITTVRVTGGEPTLHPDFIEYMQRLSQLPIERLAFTTNAIRLHQLLPQLESTNCRHINISLDSLQESGFKRITGRAALEAVLAGIDAALERGYTIKLNCVLMRHLNDHEIPDFLAFAHRKGIEIRFLELMNIGIAGDYFQQHYFSAAECLAAIALHTTVTRLPSELDATAIQYQTEQGARFGIIASESIPFCQHCSRWRLLPNGELRACLFQSDGISLCACSPAEFEERLHTVLRRKPTERLVRQEQDMYQIGG
ncbi:MAG: radical SAM protein [Leptospiraceae bacterium]|nr:radical SAM protein [Leptospiraceae bacterium]